MGITADKPKQDGSQLTLLSAIPKAIKDYIRRLIGFFELTEVEKKKAGIHLGGEGRD
jgi:hypothetical protein